MLAREQVLEQVDVGALRHQSAPVTNGPCAGRQPLEHADGRRGARASSRADAAAVAAQLERRELGERLEVGAHLALLEVLGEGSASAGVRRRGKVRAYSASLRPAGGSPPRSLDRSLEPGHVRPLLRRDRVHAARAPRRVSTSTHAPYAATDARSSASSEPSSATPEPGLRPVAGGGSPPPHEASTSAAAAPPSASRRVTDGAMRPQTSLRPVRISRADWDELIAHAREDAPNECCGYLWASGRAVEGVKRAENPRESPYGYELDSRSLLAVNELDDEGFEVGIYHSHPQEPGRAVADRHQPRPLSALALPDRLA